MMGLSAKTKSILVVGADEIEVDCYVPQKNGDLYVELQRAGNVNWLQRALVAEGFSFDYQQLLSAKSSKEVVHSLIIKKKL